MKTFETEKNNIPEGATHHGVYGCDADVYFKKNCGVYLQWKHDSWSLSGFEHHDWVKPIPKPETTEWKNGDECLVENAQGYVVNGEYEKYVGAIGVIRALFETQGGVKMVAVQHCSGDCVCWREEMLSKPESPEDKEKRERLEAAYDLYHYAKKESVYSCVIVSFKEFVSDFSAREREEYLAIVDKTNYRKGE